MNTIADIPLVVKRVRRARNFTLSYNAATQQARLSVPMRAPLKDALAFALRKQDWLKAVAVKAVPPIRLEPDAEVSVLGEPLHLRHHAGRGVTTCVGNELHVFGDVAFFERRVKDWLKAKLTEELAMHVHRNKIALGISTPTRITVKNIHSRWGSCTRDGALAFAFRLVFCPKSVVHYVAAHECAHLLVFNHSPRFWALVAQLDEDYKDAKRWLKLHAPV